MEILLCNLCHGRYAMDDATWQIYDIQSIRGAYEKKLILYAPLFLFSIFFDGQMMPLGAYTEKSILYAPLFLICGA